MYEVLYRSYPANSMKQPIKRQFRKTTYLLFYFSSPMFIRLVLIIHTTIQIFEIKNNEHMKLKLKLKDNK